MAERVKTQTPQIEGLGVTETTGECDLLEDGGNAIVGRVSRGFCKWGKWGGECRGRAR